MRKEVWQVSDVAELSFGDFGYSFSDEEDYVVDEFLVKFEDSSVRFAKSIMKHGVKEPLIIYVGDRVCKPTLINGHHRFLLATILGFKEVKVKITEDWSWKERFRYPASDWGRKTLGELLEEMFDFRIDSLQ